MRYALQAFSASTDETVLRKSYEIMTKCMSAASQTYASTPFAKEYLDAEIAYKKEVMAIKKEKLDENASNKRWQKMDAARAKYNEVLDALDLKVLEHKRASMDSMAKAGDVVPAKAPAVKAEETMKKSTEGEGSRGGKVIGHTKSGKPIYETSHEAYSSIEKFTEHYKGKLDAEGHKKAAELHRAKAKETGSKAHIHAANAHAVAAKHGSKALYPESRNGADVYGIAQHLSKMNKSEDSSALDDLLKKSDTSGKEQSMESAMDTLKDFIRKAQSMPSGDPPQQMPTTRREVDGGEVDGAGKTDGAQSPQAETVASTAGNPSPGSDEDLEEKAKGKAPEATSADLESEAGGTPLRKANFVNWEDSRDNGELALAQLQHQLLNKSMDVPFGIGFAPTKKKVEAAKAEMPSVYFQKGGAVVYVDSEDRRIEKSMARVQSGLTFTQGSQANLGAPIQHQAECGHCHELVKSYLSTCESCGVSFHKSYQEEQGLVLSKSTAASLIPTDEDEISIG